MTIVYQLIIVLVVLALAGLTMAALLAPRCPMSKTRVVIFTKNNVRICVNPPNISELKTYPNVVVDPDLSAVRSLPPHLWRLSRGKVEPMSLLQQEIRKGHIARHGLDNAIAHNPQYGPLGVNIKLKLVILGISIALLTLLAKVLIK